ncbi:amidohydrolase [Galactobacter valiniphilus]|uniref:Amidohydrolase n=1 Tax=Galactobacter valiniphilus TaxID=2676122 RepID=A0A399JA89_9MICC|nr:amidohydrolase family protein [Galactobacter valiniphilus]RII42458.1 amidohydrolase [Galactobacter valiniphilus]
MLDAEFTTPGPTSDARIPAYLEALGIPGLADVHVHFMPQNVLSKVWGFFDRVGEEFGAAPWPIHYRMPEAERVQTLRALGVAAYPTLNYPHRAGMAGWLNEYSAGFAAAHPQAVPSATFFAEPEAEATVRAALEGGARIFKVHVQVGEFAPDQGMLDGAWGLIEAAQVPVVIHAGSGPHGGTHTGPAPVRRLLEAHPRLVLVIAHAGMPEYAEFTDLAEEYPGVHLDTTMVGTDYSQALAPVPEAVLERWAAMPGKIVLGSDFPNIPHPYAHQLGALAAWGFGDSWMRAVLWENGARLMRVTGSRGVGGA